MKKYKDLNNNVWEYEEDGSQDHLITADMVVITDAEADAITNPPLTAQQVKDARVLEIDTRLNEIDILSVRSLRSKSAGRGVVQDDTMLTDLDDEAILLRTERGTLV